MLSKPIGLKPMKPTNLMKGFAASTGAQLSVLQVWTLYTLQESRMWACSLFDLLYSEHNSLDKCYRTVYVSHPFGTNLKVTESWFYEVGKWKKVDMQTLSNSQVLLVQGTKPQTVHPCVMLHYWIWNGKQMWMEILWIFVLYLALSSLLVLLRFTMNSLFFYPSRLSARFMHTWVEWGYCNKCNSTLWVALLNCTWVMVESKKPNPTVQWCISLK